jgi:hypothetical protein
LSHRKPVAWRLGWGVRTVSLLGQAIWRALSPSSPAGDVRVRLRHARYLARQAVAVQPSVVTPHDR